MRPAPSYSRRNRARTPYGYSSERGGRFRPVGFEPTDRVSDLPCTGDFNHSSTALKQWGV